MMRKKTKKKKQWELMKLEQYFYDSMILNKKIKKQEKN